MAWLTEQIETGRRCATRTQCRRCDGLLWRGDDHDRCAIEVTIDAEPVDRLHEVIALLAGRDSFELITRGHRYEIWHREPHHLAARIQPFAIHLSHSCAKENDQ